MIAIGLRLLGIWRWLKQALGALVSLARRYPLQCALIVALAACGWLWRGKERAEADRDAALREIVVQADKFHKAQAEAERLAIEARAATEKLSKGLADAADAQARYLDADSRRNLADRVRNQAPRCSASGSIAPGVPDNPARDTGADPAGVYLTLDEADALRRHEVRSVTCEGWALDLIAQGLAVE